MNTHKTTHLLTSILAMVVATLLGGMAPAQDLQNPCMLNDTAQHSVFSESAVEESDVLQVSAYRLTPSTLDSGTPRAREDVVAPNSGSGIHTAADDNSRKISARYQSAEMLGLLSRTNMNEVMSLFSEASNMIDARHVSPNSYEDRTRAALEGVSLALENPAFLQANRVSPNPQAVAAVQQQLQQMAYSQPARSMSESVGLMQYAAELANRQLGVRKEAIALEFLNATIDSLDKYSALMPKSGSEYPGAYLDNRKTAGLEENIVGIGIEMTIDSRGALLEGVIEGSPAEGLGLKAGDIIVAVNQQSVAGQSLNMIANLIGGREGTSVTLDIDRNGQMLRGTTTRRRFYVSSVSGTKMVDEASKVGYVRLKQFSESSKEDLEKAMFTLHNQGMKGLILDLRGNPGGLLDESVDVSNLFLPRGVIVSTRGRNADDNTQESASFDKTWAVPLVVLVDENSASASEIFAAAIQDNGRGVIMGRHSYGKGTVQTHFPLRTVSGVLKLTTAKFYSPTGREMAGAGVEPDLAVAEQTTVAYRGGANDTDIQSALQIIAAGTPGQMALASAQGRPMSYRQASPAQPAAPSQVQYLPQPNQVPAGQSNYPQAWGTNGNWSTLRPGNFGTTETRLPRPLPLESGLTLH
ncbi:MAG: S41 family peptidase [Planctomycetaceae bacterium]